MSPVCCRELPACMRIRLFFARGCRRTCVVYLDIPALLLRSCGLNALLCLSKHKQVKYSFSQSQEGVGRSQGTPQGTLSPVRNLEPPLPRCEANRGSLSRTVGRLPSAPAICRRIEALEAFRARANRTCRGTKDASHLKKNQNSKQQAALVPSVLLGSCIGIGEGTSVQEQS